MFRLELLLHAVLFLALAVNSALVAQRAKTQASRAELAESQGFPRNSLWFGGFPEDESTWNQEGEEIYTSDNTESQVQYGLDPVTGSEPLVNYDIEQVQGMEWFHESPSAGPWDAWQSSYPAAGASIAGNRDIQSTPWRYLSAPFDGQGWVQDSLSASYKDLDDRSNGPPTAHWFDDSVGSVDGMGRRTMPVYDSGTVFVKDAWVEQFANVTFACADAGCTATATLQAYDSSIQEAAHCKLSICVHTTDFDEFLSNEVVEYVTVNSKVVKQNCTSGANACMAGMQGGLACFGCANAIDAVNLMDEDGSMSIEAKISHAVDECPFEGNLLSGVATVTCMVRNVTETTTTTSTSTSTSELTASAVNHNALYPFCCSEPGCMTETVMFFDPTNALSGGQCFLTVILNQTDFDSSFGMHEVVEYIKFGGTVLRTNATPGHNPCFEACRNSSQRTHPNLTYVAIDQVEVTDIVLSEFPVAGRLSLEMKISEDVDECSADGCLLGGSAYIECDVGPAFVQTVAAPPSTVAVSLDKNNFLTAALRSKAKAEISPHGVTVPA